MNRPSCSATPERATPLWSKVIPIAMLGMIFVPYGLLVLLSFGSGWSFPTIMPNRIDFAPWKQLFASRSDAVQAIATSISLSLTVATISTTAGLWLGRTLRRTHRTFWRFCLYFPFVMSPVVVGICLYDLLLRFNLTGTFAGVALVQALFATSFAAIFFSAMWNPRTDRLEGLVKNLGGGFVATWRHAVLPQSIGLIAVCFLQTGLFSWLDYGLISVIGGTRITGITMILFSYLREANTNLAALSSLVLLIPPMTGIFLLMLGNSWSSSLRQKGKVSA